VTLELLQRVERALKRAGAAGTDAARDNDDDIDADDGRTDDLP
jgi:hypothetical protein